MRFFKQEAGAGGLQKALLASAPHEGEEGSRAAAEAEAQARRMAYGRSLSAGSNRAQRVADDARSRSVMLGYETPYTFSPWMARIGSARGLSERCHLRKPAGQNDRER